MDTAADSTIDEDMPEVIDRSLTDEELDDLTSPEPSPVAVTYTTQDFDVAGLVQRMNKESLLIPSFGTGDTRISTAGFQRGFVWTKTQMDRFVESLLLGYPVPGIFLVRQTTDNRLLVLDGQQRLVTLQRFYAGLHNGREFTLDNVGKDFKGLTYKSMDEPLKFKLDDSFLQATIVAADGSAEVNEAVYQIFERLNAGGTQLTPHEIRVALYAGALIEFLEKLNQGADWRALYGKPSARIRDQELILRIVALFLSAQSYARPLKTYLNAFVSHHRNLDSQVEEAGELFEQAAATLATVGPQTLRRPGGSQVNVAQTEALFVGLMHALQQGGPRIEVAEIITTLQANERFISATTKATADNEAVSERLHLAREAFRSQ